MVTNVSEETLRKALDFINQKYEGNVTFNRFEKKGSRIHFTLRVKSSKGPGHRMSVSHPMLNNKSRHLVAACWHVHGDLFDALFDLDPKAKVYAGRVGWMKSKADNWQDYNIGSMMFPSYASEACECGSY